MDRILVNKKPSKTIIDVFSDRLKMTSPSITAAMSEWFLNNKTTLA